MLIVDSVFIECVPPVVVADLGIDVLAVLTESYVCTMATHYTKGLSLEAM